MGNRVVELAKRVTAAMYDYDPYNGTDKEDILLSIYDAIREPDSRLDIIEMLTETLEDMLDKG